MRSRFESVHVVLNSLGSVLLVLSWVLLLPLVILFIYGETGKFGFGIVTAFAAPALLALALGLAFRALFRRGRLGVVRAMLVCSLGWLLCSAFGALPFVLGIRAGFLDGFFEAMSGFTTTGITVFTGLDDMPMSILFWRSLTQWVGGLGILTFFLAVTYQAGTAHQLFGAESHKIGMPRPVPGIAGTLKVLWSIYAGYTALVTLALFLAGMPFMDAICHSFTALSTGGFSPHDASIAFYQAAGDPNYIWYEYILIAGMLFGGINFLVHFRLAKRGPRALVEGAEVRWWWWLIAGFTLVILAERFLLTGFGGTAGLLARIEEGFRSVLFQVVSILTTTGFGTQDIALGYFGHAARLLFLVMMVIGGCTGSTGGGIKVLRVAILYRVVRREVFRLVAPSRAVSMIIIDGKPLDESEQARVAGLFFAWMLLLVAGGCATALLSRYDALQSASGMFSALGNIGPCYIPTPEMGLLHPVVKIVYIIGMLAGRLEILPVIMLFSRRAWQS